MIDRNTWQTPKFFLDLVSMVAPIGVDPCAGPDTRIGRVNIPQSDLICGLKADWCILQNPGEIWFCNPPYGRHLSGPIDCNAPVFSKGEIVGRGVGWARKIVQQGAVCAGIALVPVRTDATWWCELYETCDSCLAWKSEGRSRLSFTDPTTGLARAGNDHASCVFFFGNNQLRERFLSVFSEHGTRLK